VPRTPLPSAIRKDTNVSSHSETISAQNRHPISRCYFDKLPESFREPALLDRFHGFIEGWYLPRINKDMIFKGWTVNVEYFPEVLHTLRTQTVYGQLFDELVHYERKADNRDFNAVKRLIVAYMKLLFPHRTAISEVNGSELDTYCLQPSIHRRGIIKAQCHYIDPEFKVEMHISRKVRSHTLFISKKVLHLTHIISKKV